MRKIPAAPRPNAAPAPSRTTFVAGAILLLAAGLAYANSFSVPLIFDDWITIQHNPHLAKLWPIWSALFPPEGTGVGGRPIANLSFVLNYAVSGSSMAGFHAVNLGLHALAGLLLFAIVRRTLKRWQPGNGAARHTTLVALAAAAYWTLQPVQTESVTYVSQRTEVLMGLFYFLTIYGFVRATEPDASWWWRPVAVAACFAGMASKEGMVTAPVMVLLYDHAFVAGSFGEAWRRRWRLHLALCSSWLLLPFLMGGLHGRGVGFGHGMNAFSYLLIECGAIVRYLALTLWPWPLVFDYGTDLPPAGFAEFGGAAGLLALAGATVWALWRRPGWGFLGAWFLITLAPTSSVVPIPLQPISENRVYVPSAAVGVAVAVALHTTLGRRSFVLLAGMAAMFAGLTFARNRDYRSEIGLWADTVVKRPTSARAHNNLGHALQAVGRWQEAKVAHETALKLRPDYADAHANLASALGRLGLADDALEHGRQAVRLEPTNATGQYNLGVAARDKGHLPESLAAFEAAVRLRPDFVSARENLALALLHAGRVPEAIAQAEAAVRLAPTSLDMRYLLACLLSRGGRSAEAVPLFHEMLQARPNHLEARHNLGLTLQMMGRTAEAVEAFTAVTRLDPHHAGAHTALGGILMAGGRHAEAASHFAIVVHANPGSAESQTNLGIALANAGQTADAIGHLNTALQLNPNLAPAREALRQLASRGNPPK